MSVDISLQEFTAFLGTEEGIHSVSLPDIFSSGGSLNLYIDKYGRAKRIDGYTKQKASALTTDTGGSAATFTTLFHYATGPTANQLVAILDDAVNEWEIWASTDEGVTWTFKSDLGATPVGILGDFAQFGSTLYVTSGKVAPKKYDGTSISAAGYLQSPQPTASAGSAGLLDGVYLYKLRARMNDGTTKGGSLASAQISIQNLQVSLSWTADADTNVIGYEIYRTFGTGAVFYYLAYVDGRTTVAYTDNTSDTVLQSSPAIVNHGDAPPTTYFLEPHKQRMWWLKTDTFPTRAWWSDAGLPESVYAQNFLDFSDSDTHGDPITGAVGNAVGDALVVFTEQAIWTVSGTGALTGLIVDWNRSRSNAQTGSVSSRTALRVPSGARFADQTGSVRTTASPTLAYFTPLLDIRLFDGQDDEVVSHPVKDTLSTVNWAARASIWAVNDSARSQFIWFVPTGSATTPNTAVAWNYRWGVWYVWQLAGPMVHGVEIHSSSVANHILLSEGSISTGAFVYYFFNGNNFNGASIPAHWMTKTLRGNLAYSSQTPGDYQASAIPQTKRFRWVDLLFEATDPSTTLTVEWFTGDADDSASAVGSVIVAPSLATIVDADGDTVLSGSGDTLALAAANSQTFVQLQTSNEDYLHHEGMRLRIGNNATTPTWALEAFTLAYQVLPGLKRRAQ